jgi:hypothetical protein
MKTNRISFFLERETILASLMLTIILLAGLAVRVLGFGEFYFSPDDMLHLYIASGRDLGEVMARSSGQVHPPLIFFLLHYMLLMSRNEIFLRCISLAPYFGSIVAIFFLGKRLGSFIFGLAMAYFLAFSNASIVQSQTIRPYSLLVLLVILSLLFIVSYFKTGDARHLKYFFGAIFLESMLHYSSVIANFSIGVVWFSRMMIEFRGRSKTGGGEEARRFLQTESKRMGAIYLPIVATLGFFYLFHLSNIIKTGLYDDLKQSYLSPFFFDNQEGMWANIGNLFSFFSFYSYFHLVFALAVWGAIYLSIKGDRYILAISLVAISTNILLAFLKYYPFGGSRHSMVLLPFVAVLVGASFESMKSMLVAGSRGIARKRSVAPAGLERLAWYLFLLGVGLAAMAHVSYFSGTHKGLRFMNPGEFVTKKQAWNRIQNYLINNTTPKDIILTNWQSFVYLAYIFRDGTVRQAGKYTIEIQSPSHGLVYCPQPDGCFWNSYDEVSNAIRVALEYQKSSGYEGGKIYLMDVGWTGPYSFWQDSRLQWAVEPLIISNHEHLVRINSFRLPP